MTADVASFADIAALPGDRGPKPAVREKVLHHELPREATMGVCGDNFTDHRATSVNSPRATGGNPSPRTEKSETGGGEILKAETTGQNSYQPLFGAAKNAPDLREALAGNPCSSFSSSIEGDISPEFSAQGPWADENKRIPRTIPSSSSSSQGANLEEVGLSEDGGGQYRPCCSSLPNRASFSPTASTTSAASSVTATAPPQATPTNDWLALKAHILARDRALRDLLHEPSKGVTDTGGGANNENRGKTMPPPMRPACDLCKTCPLAIPSLTPHDFVAAPPLLTVQPGEEVAVVLPCGHMFGNDCLVKHLLKFADPMLRECPACEFRLAFARGECKHPLRGVALSPYSFDPFGKVPPVMGEDGFFVPETCTACRVKRLEDVFLGRIKGAVLGREVRGGEARAGRNEWCLDQFSGSDASALLGCRDAWADKAEQALQNLMMVEKVLEGVRPTWAGQWP